MPSGSYFSPHLVDKDFAMQLKDLKQKTPAELLAYAEELNVENATSLRTQDLMYAILKKLAESETTLFGEGVLEVCQDGFGFLRSPEANYLAGPDDIYVAPAQIKKYGLQHGRYVGRGNSRAQK